MYTDAIYCILREQSSLGTEKSTNEQRKKATDSNGIQITNPIAQSLYHNVLLSIFYMMTSASKRLLERHLGNVMFFYNI